MPQYLAPGVYVEEVSYRTKSIEGVGTTTTAFVGPTRYGPLYDPLAVLTSLSDYEQIYGDGQPLEFSDAGEMDNFMWHAVRAFFFEGGSTLTSSGSATPIRIPALSTRRRPPVPPETRPGSG